MATNKHATVRYNVLDKCFSSSHRYTFDELIKACSEAIYMEYGDDSGVSTRTIRDDIRFMKSEEGWAAPIVTRKDGGKPYYTYEGEFSIRQQKLSTAETEQLKSMLITLSRFKGLPQFEWMTDLVTRLEGEFQLNCNISEAVGFAQNPYLKGLEHFDGLFQAIVSKRALRICYHPAFGGAIEYIVHPYYLKQYNNRWFLFGKYDDMMMNMALDRIESFVDSSVDYKENTDVNFNEYFDDVVGVTVPYGSKPEIIKLLIDKKRYKYIESKPIHPTQTVLNEECTDEAVMVKLELITNYEFQTLLLGFADSIDIIEPVTLREDIKNRANNILQKNK